MGLRPMGGETSRRCGPEFIAEQAKRLALEGDDAEVATWLAIADRYDALNEDACRSRQ